MEDRGGGEGRKKGCEGGNGIYVCMVWLRTHGRSESGKNFDKPPTPPS